VEQHSEGLDSRSDQEPEIQASGDVGTAGEAAAESRADPAAPDAHAEAAQDVEAWDGEEHADAVEWDAGEDADAVAWDAGETAGEAAPDPDVPRQRPATGEPRVDAALARLDELASRPVAEHRAIFEDVHRRLRDVLGELDTREQNSGGQAAAAGAERRAGR
jgi:hypothetical protein